MHQLIFLILLLQLLQSTGKESVKIESKKKIYIYKRHRNYTEQTIRLKRARRLGISLETEIRISEQIMPAGKLVKMFAPNRGYCLDIIKTPCIISQLNQIGSFIQENSFIRVLTVKTKYHIKLFGLGFGHYITLYILI